MVSRCVLLLLTNSPIALSISLIRFCNAATYVREVEAAYLSFIISALFSDMPLCISAHMRPYYCIVKLLRSTPLASITYQLCSIVQLLVTFLSKSLIVLFASMSCYLRKLVSCTYYLSWCPTYACNCANSASRFMLLLTN